MLKLWRIPYVCIKLAKDIDLDRVVQATKFLRSVSAIKDIMKKHHPRGCPLYVISGSLERLPADGRVLKYMNKFPHVFQRFRGHVECEIPWFRLTDAAYKIALEEENLERNLEPDFVERICKLLMMTENRIISKKVLDDLRWDLGLPHDYFSALIQRHPDYFRVVDIELSPRSKFRHHFDSELVGIELLKWNEEFAVSVLEKKYLEASRTKSPLSELLDPWMDGDVDEVCTQRKPINIPVSFSKGYGCNRPQFRQIEKWQKLPYLSPYKECPPLLNPRTSLVFKKRVVGLFHEVLSLTLHKMSPVNNFMYFKDFFPVSNLCWKVFGQNPQVFYVYKRSGLRLQTAVLKDAFHGKKIIDKHPLLTVRNKLALLIARGSSRQRLYPHFDRFGDAEGKPKQIQNSVYDLSNDLDFDDLLYDPKKDFGSSDNEENGGDSSDEGNCGETASDKRLLGQFIKEEKENIQC